MTMIHQLLETAKGKVDQVILNTHNVKYFAKDLSSAKIPALIINNRLPIDDTVDMKDIQVLRTKGVEYYPSGRTGMPALVSAEDGLALPGSVLATTDKNLLELSVLGTYVLLLDEKKMLSLLENGNLDNPEPKTINIVLQGKPGEWIGGTDIALYLINYFKLPEDKNTLLEIHGEGLNALLLNERFNLARTLIGLGYEHLLFQVDDVVMAFLQDRSEGEGHYYFPDEETNINSTIKIELQKIHPMIAWKEKDEIFEKLQSQISRSQRHNSRRLVKKTSRESTDLVCSKSFHHFMLCKRDCYTAAMVAFLDDLEQVLDGIEDPLLKLCNSSMVGRVRIGEQELVVKRYNIKGFFHGLRRAFMVTRAMHSWRNAHQLLKMGISTSRPVALFEKRFGPFRSESYFISEYLEGPDVLVFFKTADHYQKIAIARRVAEIFRKLKSAKISHGDMKGTNIVIHRQEPALIDLDAMRVHISAGRFDAAHRKDIKRFFKNWVDIPDIYGLFQEFL